MTALAGTGPLVRLALRVDRVRLPVWVAAVTLVVVATAVSFGGLYPDVASRQVLASGIGRNPALRALYGELFAPTSLGGLTVWRQGVFLLVLVGLLNLLTVVRHTRAEEEAGRLELVGATAVGRRAPLAAALATAALADLGVATAITVGMVAAGQPAAGSLALGAAVGAMGLAFAGIAAVTAQVVEDARTASGLAGAVLAAAFLLRAAGDAAGDGAVGALSWASPMGWAQQVRPYGDQRWWPLALLLLLGLAGVAVADRLLAARDLGGGLVAPRAGPPRAADWLASPWGLAWRLQRGTLQWWALGLVVAGLVFGGVVDAITQLFEDTPQLAAIIERLGGTGRIVDGFLGAILGVFALLVAAHGVAVVLRLRAEEVAVRAEPVLAGAVTRWSWAGSHLVVAFGAPVVLLVLAGGAAGLAAGLVTGAGVGEAPRLATAALAHVPAAWVVVGIAVLAVGAVPHRATLAYGALAVFVLLGQVGEALELDQVWLNLSPFTHTPDVLGTPVAWTPLVWLALTAVTLTGLGLLALRRRDLAP